MALIGGGIGITPIRSLLEEMDGDLVLVYRVLSEDDVILGDELRGLAADKGAALHVVAGDHRTPEGRGLLTAAHLLSLVPDLAEREVYVCGPPAMADATRKQRPEGSCPVPLRPHRALRALTETGEPDETEAHGSTGGGDPRRSHRERRRRDRHGVGDAEEDRRHEEGRPGRPSRPTAGAPSR